MTSVRLPAHQRRARRQSQLPETPYGVVKQYETGRFDFALTKFPFKVTSLDKQRLQNCVDPYRRLHFRPPHTDNANNLPTKLFHSAKN